MRIIVDKFWLTVRNVLVFHNAHDNWAKFLAGKWENEYLNTVASERCCDTWGKTTTNIHLPFDDPAQIKLVMSASRW